MKITNKQYPVLYLFDKTYLSNLSYATHYYYQTKQDIKSNKYDFYIKSILSGYYCGLPIYNISKKFSEAAIKNEEKLTKLYYDKNVRTEVLENCILIYSNLIMAYKDGLYTVFTNAGRILAITKFNADDDKNISEYKCEKIYFSEYGKNQGYSEWHFITYYFKLMIFKKYASVDLVFIEKGKKKKTNLVDKGKIINDTNLDIIYLDSTWFREIVRTEGFKVRGHFRLQPYKDENGQWTRRIIYINEFEKHGYHRKAKVAVEQETIEQATS